jgi:hypothetical protein
MVPAGETPGGCDAAAAAAALLAAGPVAPGSAPPGSARAPGSGARGRPPGAGLSEAALTSLADFVLRSGEKKMDKVGAGGGGVCGAAALVGTPWLRCTPRVQQLLALEGGGGRVCHVEPP